MHRSLNAQKTLLANGKAEREPAGANSLKTFILKLPARLYNAAFTSMGRKNLLYFLKREQLRFDLTYQRKGALVYRLKNGNNFVLHRGNQLSELVYLEGAYEPLETLIVSKVVQPGDVVLDLGANVGYFTALLDRLVGPSGQVHSFEPGDGTFTKLKTTKKLLKLDQAVLHAKAVSDTVGHIDFWSSTSGSDAQQNTGRNAALGRHLRHDKVAAITLDSFLGTIRARRQADIALVKCDIEGAESAMLRGATNLLRAKNPPVWLLEHNRPALCEQGATSADLLAPFADADIYFTPICWPPSRMGAFPAAKWNGVADDLPDECNLIIFPTRGTYARRISAIKQAGLLAA